MIPVYVAATAFTQFKNVSFFRRKSITFNIVGYFDNPYMSENNRVDNYNIVLKKRYNKIFFGCGDYFISNIYVKLPEKISSYMIKYDIGFMVKYKEYIKDNNRYTRIKFIVPKDKYIKLKLMGLFDIL